MRFSKRNPWIRVGLPSSLLTLVATLVVANLGDQQKDIDYRFTRISDVGSREFRLTLENMMGPSAVEGNRITTYQNGNEIFPAMLRAIRGAKETINFESYIYISGETGNRFVDALAERARAGVKVHLLIDWAGSQKIEDGMIDRLRNAGVEVRFFHPLGWFTITRMNNRTHRKLLIVDAKIGFTGGVGISDDWEGDGKTPGRWRDSHFKVVGPVVGQLQSTFTDDWVATSPNVLYGKEYFPPIEPVGPVRAQMFKSAPREGAASAELMYLLAIRAAKREILLQYAYFVPGELALKSLHDARARGVRIRLIVPGAQVDSEWTRLASRQNYGELLEDGVEIYEYQPALYHVKAMIIDDAFASVGSTNFDDRSFRLNSEANLNVFDEGFARTLKTAFEADLALSKRVTLEEWKRRSLKEKTLGALVTLIDNQL